MQLAWQEGEDMITSWFQGPATTIAVSLLWAGSFAISKLFFLVDHIIGRLLFLLFIFVRVMIQMLRGYDWRFLAMTVLKFNVFGNTYICIWNISAVAAISADDFVVKKFVVIKLDLAGQPPLGCSVLAIFLLPSLSSGSQKPSQAKSNIDNSRNWQICVQPVLWCSETSVNWSWPKHFNAGWQMLRDRATGGPWKVRVFYERRDPVLSRFTYFLKGFHRACYESHPALGELSTKVNLLLKGFQQKSACFCRGFGEPALGELS